MYTDDLMNIREFLKSSDGTMLQAGKKLASELGVKEVTVRSWASGQRHPRRQIWGDIERATNGAVTKLDLAG